MGIWGFYFLFAFLVGLVARNRKLGFWGGFILSLLFSPIIGLIISLISQKKQSVIYIERDSVQKDAPKSGKFWLTGFFHLSPDVQQMIWKELKKNDTVQFIADPTNEFDNQAIQVHYKNIQIGWCPRDYYRKSELFNKLHNGNIVSGKCLDNYRKQYYENGDINHYKGMAQYVEVQFTYQ